MKTLEKKVSLHTPAGEAKELQKVVTFRVKPSQWKYWNEKAKELGVKDFSAFVRGAINSAVFTSMRAKDSKWQEFVEAMQPTAKKILGHGFYDGGAKDMESTGTYYKTFPAVETISRLKKKHHIS